MFFPTNHRGLQIHHCILFVCMCFTGAPGLGLVLGGSQMVITFWFILVGHVFSSRNFSDYYYSNSPIWETFLGVIALWLIGTSPEETVSVRISPMTNLFFFSHRKRRRVLSSSQKRQIILFTTTTRVRRWLPLSLLLPCWSLFLWSIRSKPFRNALPMRGLMLSLKH